MTSNSPQMTLALWIRLNYKINLERNRIITFQICLKGPEKSQICLNDLKKPPRPDLRVIIGSPFGPVFGTGS